MNPDDKRIVQPHLDHKDPAEAPESEIVGRPTMLAKFQGRLEAQPILDALQSVGYPLDDVSVLFKYLGSDEVIDLITGHVPAGQSLTDEEVDPKKLAKGVGQTAVLLHPDKEQLEAVKRALSQVGNAEIEYSGETHAHGRVGGVERHDEQVP